jgi:hypothetical protein
MWFRTRREHKRRMRCARGNTAAAAVEERIFLWNMGGLRADAGMPKSKSTDVMTIHEATTSRDKLSWLEAQMLVAEPDIIFLSEVSGNILCMRAGLLKWFGKRGYSLAALPGEGGGAGTELSNANGLVIAMRVGHADGFKTRST